jgi:DNA polymerase-3 subunit alpha
MFIHLRAYSDYSFGASNLKLKKIIMHCYDQQMPAIAISDRNMFGTLEFAIGAAASGIQPIIGYSVDVDCKDISASFDNHELANIGEVLLIVKSEIGYSNLLKIATRVCADKQQNAQPSVEWSFLSSHSQGLIALFSAIDDSKLLSRVLENHGINGAKTLMKLVQTETELGPFIELTRYSDGRHIQSESRLIDIAYELEIPMVATNPINFLNHKTYEAAEALHCIINNRFISEDNRSRINPEHYFKSQDEMSKLFEDLPEAIENTVLIAKKCHFFPTKQSIRIPKYDPNLDANLVLEKMATDGLNERITELVVNKEVYFARLKFELDLIQNMHFSDYFLIVSDFIQWSKSQGIAVGPGRGSGAGSIVAWSIKITELDPIEHGLLFERFLNPERISMPDFDIDFCQLRRDEVLKYIVHKYGKAKIAHIITFGKLQPRAVLRDVGRVLQMPYGQIDRLCKMIPQNQANPVTLQQAIDLDKQLQKMREEDPAIDRLLTVGLQLEGCHRNISTHAAGLIIAQQPIVEVMPLYKDAESGTLSGQFSMKYVEAAGLIKFDFLGLKTLTVISNTEKLISSSIGETLNMYKIPADDPETYSMLSEGNVLGVFQLEGSAGIREAVKQLKPDKLGDIIALTSLYRPGPMENIPTYVARKHGTQAVNVLHPDLKEVLNETYGIIVYQEQVIKIAQILAGYSLGEADILRRAMGKKDKLEMQQQRAVFVGKSIARGLDEERAEEIFDLVNKFASYGFNKAHAAAYAVVTYQTAYLRCHYLIEFLVASINLEIHSQEKVSALCDEARKNGIAVARPSINYSMVFFAIEVIDENGNIIGVINHDLTEMQVHSNLTSEVVKQNKKRIRYGLGGVKSTGIRALSEIIKEREKGGKFKNLDDFLNRTAAKGFNKRLFEQLVRSGAIDELYDNGNELLQNIDKINNYVASISRYKADEMKQISLFDLMTSHNERSIISELAPQEYWSKAEKLQMEHKALGFYLTEHPVLLYRDILKKYPLTFSTEIDSYTSNESKEINIAGVVKECKIRSGKGEKAGKYAFLEVVDPYGIIDISIFDSNILTKQIKLLDSGQLIFCTATIRNDAQGQRILLRNIKSLMQAVEEAIPYFKIFLSTIKAAEMVHQKLSHELQKDGGTIKIKVVAVCQDGSEVEFYSDQSLHVSHAFISDMMDQEGIAIESL